MGNWVATVALIAAVVLAVVAFAALASGRYLLAGVSFLLLSVSIYVKETRTE